MSLVQIAPVTRQGMKLLISLFGLSETGKTYSALKLMAGIEPDPKKRGLLVVTKPYKGILPILLLGCFHRLEKRLLLLSHTLHLSHLLW